MSKNYFKIINVFFIIAILGARSLIITEFTTGNGCPKFGAVPACLIILICFILPLISHLLIKWNLIYFLFTGIAALIALVASVMQFIGNAECPKSDSGIPMCYLSLLIFTSLITLKKIQLDYVNYK
ncbi:hypothetical protein [Maribacter sp. Hel_I_7]|uniref:hypothetical protein n=1 Tax=Maribacter sp. Hel_I_7 TaxID=1249997 RepID=UPI00047ECDE5|nr:hypothetical protein [Maribacter sp. Hel_I_7]